jgi:hypothetical protein
MVHGGENDEDAMRYSKVPVPKVHHVHVLVWIGKSLMREGGGGRRGGGGGNYRMERPTHLRLHVNVNVKKDY